MNHLLFIFLVICAFLVGGAFGALSTDPRIISEKLHSCETKGGKYSIFWNDYTDEYHEQCEIKAQEITDF